MAKTWKEVVRPGTYWYLDESTGQPASMTATAEDTRYWHDQGKAMLAAGLSIPVPLEHQNEAVPLTKAEKDAKNLLHNAGWIEDYQIREGDRLYALTHTDDAVVDPKKLPTTIKFTSPHINSFTDGDGKKWDGVITHLALTSRPRIARQEPFKTENAALSLLPPAPRPFAKQSMPGLDLSLAGRLTDEKKPVFSGAFAIWSGVKLDTTPFEPKKKKMEEGGEKKKDPMGEKGEGAKEKDTSNDGKDGAGGEKEGMEGRVEGDARDFLEGEMEGEEEMDLVDVAVDLMSIFDVELGEGVDEGNLLQRLLQALTSKLKVDKGTDPAMKEPEKPKMPGSPAGAAPVVQESPPMFMSLEQIEKIADPNVKAMAVRGFKRDQKMMADAKIVFDQRVERVARKVPVKARDILLNQAKGARFSMDEDGTVRNTMQEALELLDAGIMDVPSIMLGGGVTVTDHPEEYNGGISEKRAGEIADGLIADPNKK